MKILYDFQMFSIQKYGGVSRYFCELMKNIPPENQFKLALLFSDNQHLQEYHHIFKKPNLLPNRNFKGKYYLERALFNLNQVYSKYYISNKNFDLLHPTYYDNYFLKELKKPYILTVHDLILFKFENMYNQSNLMREKMKSVIKNANRLIAISENTKKDIIEILKINPEKIDVIYHGFNKTSSLENYARFGKYILFVGRRDLYKNFIIFVEAVSKLLKKEKDIKLVCVGSPFNDEEMIILSKFEILNQSIALNVNDASLNGLYSHALAFVFPSIYEGFGMPILEAFANNCPVCLSNTSCFPEIAGNAGVYFDPYDPQSILCAIEKVVYCSDYAKEVSIAGQNRLEYFSWTKTAEQTTSSYLKAV